MVDAERGPAISKSAFVGDGMNISGIGSGPSSASAASASGRPFDVAYRAASQRLLQARDDETAQSGGGGGGGDGVDRARLAPSRSREEKVARQLLQRRLELGRIQPSSCSRSCSRSRSRSRSCSRGVGDELAGIAFAGRELAHGDGDGDGAPSFLKKVHVVSQKPKSFVNDEDSQDDILDNDFIREASLWHNIYRRHHNTPPLKISARLCGKAQAWANHLAHTNTFSYENDKKVGQNIFCRLAQDAQTDTTGNFTQIVWKNTRYFGIGRARSRVGKVSIVANYQPPGNINGLFKDNVLPPLANTDFL